MKEYKVLHIVSLPKEEGNDKQRFINIQLLQDHYNDGWEPHSAVAVPGCGAGGGYSYFHPYTLYTLVRDKTSFPDLPE